MIKPANAWPEALPIGNGRLGAMVFGKVENELIQLNRQLRSGLVVPVRDSVNPGAYAYLSIVRQALFKTDYKKAHDMVKTYAGAYIRRVTCLWPICIYTRILKVPLYKLCTGPGYCQCRYNYLLQC